MTDEQMIKANEHIPTAEIIADIQATEAEIVWMEREAEHFERTPMSLPHARWDHMRASARRTGIAERKAFVSKLNHLLELRGVITKEIQEVG